MLRLAKKGLLGKAKDRPDLVRKVLAKWRRDGFWATFQSVRQQLDREVPVGYSVCGEVIEVGAKSPEFQVGQRVACAGAGYANHAEVNYIPRLLAAVVPDRVASEAAAYATVGAVALRGVIEEGTWSLAIDGAKPVTIAAKTPAKRNKKSPPPKPAKPVVWRLPLPHPTPGPIDLALTVRCQSRTGRLVLDAWRPKPVE